MQEGGRFTFSCSELFLISCKVLLSIAESKRNVYDRYGKEGLSGGGGGGGKEISVKVSIFISLSVTLCMKCRHASGGNSWTFGICIGALTACNDSCVCSVIFVEVWCHL